MTEEQLQAKIFQYMWNYYPQTRRKFFHVSNELSNDLRYVMNEVERNVKEKRGNIFYLPSWFKILKQKIEKRIAIYLGKRQSIGVVAGIPDMILLDSGSAFGFELKTETGTLSPAQKEVHKVWAEDGTPVWVIRSFEEFINVIVTIIGKPQVKLAS